MSKIPEHELAWSDRHRRIAHAHYSPAWLIEQVMAHLASAVRTRPVRGYGVLEPHEASENELVIELRRRGWWSKEDAAQLVQRMTGEGDWPALLVARRVAKNETGRGMTAYRPAPVAAPPPAPTVPDGLSPTDWADFVLRTWPPLADPFSEPVVDVTDPHEVVLWADMQRTEAEWPDPLGIMASAALGARVSAKAENRRRAAEQEARVISESGERREQAHRDACAQRAAEREAMWQRWQAGRLDWEGPSVFGLPDTQTVDIPRPCIERDCQELTTNGSRCVPCESRRAATVRGRKYHHDRAMGYDRAPWRRLRAQAVRMQPWCTDCGTTDDLTVDHLPSAIDRLDAGLPVELRHVEVVCRRCNSKRGPAKDRAVRLAGRP